MPRRIAPEGLDTAPAPVARRNLADIVRINRYFGGHAISRQLLYHLHPPARFTLLDVGAASGDHARLIRAAFPGATVFCADRLARNLAAAPPPVFVADAFRLPLAPAAVDYVFCSLFLHHFPDDAVVSLLRSFATIARRALIAIDLYRHPCAKWFLRASAPFFRWHPLTVADGAASVDAAFTPAEFRRLAAAAGLDASIRSHFPWFRLSLVTQFKK
jgi:SAM-dependent methyltransferase